MIVEGPEARREAAQRADPSQLQRDEIEDVGSLDRADKGSGAVRLRLYLLERIPAAQSVGKPPARGETHPSDVTGVRARFNGALRIGITIPNVSDPWAHETSVGAVDACLEPLQPALVDQVEAQLPESIACVEVSEAGSQHQR